MHELRTIFLYGLNDRIGDEFKTDNKHINVTDKFSSLPRKHSRANRGKNHKGASCHQVETKLPVAHQITLLMFQKRHYVAKSLAVRL